MTKEELLERKRQGLIIPEELQHIMNDMPADHKSPRCLYFADYLIEAIENKGFKIRKE